METVQIIASGRGTVRPNWGNNKLVLLDFLERAIPYLDKTGSHIDVGHGKKVEFPVFMARRFPNGKIIYYDTSDALERARKWWQGEHAKHKIGELGPPQNLYFKSYSELKLEDYTGVSYFFTAHHFPNPLESMQETYKLLKPEGKLLVVDYDLAWVRNEPNPDDLLKQILCHDNERQVIAEEEGWFNSHTTYSLDQSITDAEAAGFRELHSEVQERKLFLYIGQKIEK